MDGVVLSHFLAMFSFCEEESLLDRQEMSLNCCTYSCVISFAFLGDVLYRCKLACLT